MNTPVLDHDDDLRCAEYVLGVLDKDERTAFERSMQRDSRFAETVARWQERLIPLSEDIDSLAPPAYVWTDIQRELKLAPRADAHLRTSLWESVWLWRWVGVTSSAIAAALATVSLVSLEQSRVNAPSDHGYLVANLQPQGRGAGWTATLDMQHASLVVVPTASVQFASNQSTQLWVIPSGMKPISLGIIAADRPVVVKLPHERVADMAGKAVLAISLEPSGGSPTGQPTGPVLAAGPVGRT